MSDTPQVRFITLRLPLPLDQQLEALRVKQADTKAAIIRQFIRIGLRDEERETRGSSRG